MPLVQTAPWGLGPQLPETHLTPGTQSASERQSGKHCPAVASQLKGAQIVCGPVWQLPMPSQTWAPVTAAPAHVPGLHTMPAGYWRQLPLPSQVPSRPQVATSDFGHVAADGRRAAGRNERADARRARDVAGFTGVRAGAVATDAVRTEAAGAVGRTATGLAVRLLRVERAAARDVAFRRRGVRGRASGLAGLEVLPQPAARKAKASEAMTAMRAQATTPGGGRRGKLIVPEIWRLVASDHKCKLPKVRAISCRRASRGLQLRRGVLARPHRCA